MIIPNEHLYVAIAIILIVVFLAYMSYCNSYNNDYLYGMWEADKEFSEEAGMNTIMVMMGPSQGGYWSDYRKMYVLMYNDEGVEINQTVDIKIDPTWTMVGSYQNRMIHITDPDFTAMPHNMLMSVSVKDGHMIFYGVGDEKNTIYLSVYKDHDSTHKAKLLEKLADASEDPESSNDD